MSTYTVACHKQQRSVGSNTSILHRVFLESTAIGGELRVPQGRQGKPQIFLDRHLPLLSKTHNKYSDELLMLL